MYCTVDQARAAGATGSDAEVIAAITAAADRVDRHTREWWETRSATVAASVLADGLTLLPRRVQTVTAVVALLDHTPDTPIPATAYRVTSSAVLGHVDALHLGCGAHGGWDDLVAGAESWNGGWAGLLGRWSAERVEVTGTWGWVSPPSAVAEATALVAAWIQQQARTGQVDPEAPAGSPGLDVDDEGNNVRITAAKPSTEDGDAPGLRPPTGSPAADALLRPYLRSGPRLEGV
ncbi:hypothetical protein B4N89_02350 [Embleya scabrispora]|uniref:Uncharacterized protein n=1 Tax=Embleya scabrispora TaxID=159449 RepID=A0A1T3NSZ9_9ACTN|nr:hypothetical protein [Embleya scabrispora]OPC79938.1 hypothetical protein B4N89_02350 [Embleya scabrispora]